MDAVFKVLVATDALCVLAILFMLYNLVRWKDELHGLFGKRTRSNEEDA